MSELCMLTTDRITRDFVFKTLWRMAQDGLLGSLLARASRPNQYGNVNIDMSLADGRDLHLTTLFRVSAGQLTEKDLAQAGQARFFAKPLYYDGYHYYVSNQWVDNENEASRLHYRTFQTVVNRLFSGIYSLSTEADEYILFREVTMVSKPFLLLAGLSGTGKSQFVRSQARATSAPSQSNFMLVAVRPDWHEPSDLLGYVSRINGAHYVVTDFLRFMVAAWLDATNDDATLKAPSQMRPHWLCLDEMNLAPVEQYFADYLSILETRQWLNDEYSCDALIKSETFTSLGAPGLAELGRNLLGEMSNGSKEAQLWDRFQRHGIPIPPNLIVAGTVNMDETTHGFSRKVIDRALTFDFGEFFSNDFDDFFAPQSISFKALTFPVHSHATQTALKNIRADEGGAKSIAFLKSINGVLKKSPFELAYRALNELLLSVICFNPQDEEHLHAVWDDFLMQKVLPRIEGDGAKLATGLSEVELGALMVADPDVAGKQIAERLELIEGNSRRATVLHDLYVLLQEPSLLGTVWPKEAQRPDLLRLQEGKPMSVACRSRKKIEWMLKRLKANHFTDFWA